METDAPAAQAELPDEPMPGESMELEAVRDFTPVVTRGLPTDNEIRRMWRIAASLHASGYFKDVKKAEEAFGKIIMGHDLGLTPAQSMVGIHIVEGKPQLHYATMGAFIRSREGYDYRVVEHSAESCSIAFYRHGDKLGISTFTIEDAKTMRLQIDKAGSGWQKSRPTMLLARALSQGVRWYMPEVLGGVPVYVEGEIEPSRRIAGSGEPEGIELGPKVEAVLIRAKALGHEGIADRGAAEMALGDQSPQVVDQWCASMHAELDKIDPEKQPEAPDAEAEEKPDEAVDAEAVEGASPDAA